MKKIENVNAENSKKQQELTEEVQNLASAPAEAIKEAVELPSNINALLDVAVDHLGNAEQQQGKAEEVVAEVLTSMHKDGTLNLARYNMVKSDLEDKVEQSLELTNKQAKKRVRDLMLNARELCGIDKPTSTSLESTAKNKTKEARKKKVSNAVKLGVAKVQEEIERLSSALGNAVTKKELKEIQAEQNIFFDAKAQLTSAETEAEAELFRCTKKEIREQVNDFLNEVKKLSPALQSLLLAMLEFRKTEYNGVFGMFLKATENIEQVKEDFKRMESDILAKHKKEDKTEK